MPKISYFLLFPAVISMIAGCKSYDTPIKNNTRAIRQLQKSNIQRNRVLRQQLTRARENVRMYEEQVGKLNARLDALQDSYSNLVQIVNELRRLLDEKGQNTQVLASDLAKLRKQLKAEREDRRKEMDKVVDVVTKETTAAINKISKARAVSRRKLKGPIGSGEFYEYKVQKGATLSAIAKAYKVRVKDIRKANGLTNDIIYVGQKLYIPKKK